MVQGTTALHHQLPVLVPALLAQRGPVAPLWATQPWPHQQHMQAGQDWQPVHQVLPGDGHTGLPAILRPHHMQGKDGCRGQAWPHLLQHVEGCEGESEAL